MFETNQYDLFIEQEDLTGIAIGVAVRYDTTLTLYVPSNSSTLDNAAIYGFVTRIGEGGFYIKATGLLSNTFTGLTVGSRYYLQDEFLPSQFNVTPGTIEVLVFRAISSTSAIIETVREIPSGLGIPVDITALTNQVNLLDNQINDTGGILERLDGHDDDIDTINSVTIPALDTRLDTIEGGTVGGYDLSDISSDITVLQNDVDTLELSMGSAETNITNLQSNVSTLNSTTSTNSSNISTLQTDVISLEDRMDTAESDITTIESDITDIESDITTINSQITSLQNTGLLPYGYIDGFVFREVTADIISISGGACKTQDGLYDMVTPMSLPNDGVALSIDRSVTGVGGVAGVLSNNSIAYVWVISNGTNVSACVTPAAYQPNVIGYGRYRLIGFVHINGSGEFYSSTDIRLIGRTNTRRVIFGGSNIYNKIADSAPEVVGYTNIDLTNLIPKTHSLSGGFPGFQLAQVTRLKIGIRADIGNTATGASVILVGGYDEESNNGGGASGVYHSVHMYPSYSGFLNKFESVVDIEGDRISYTVSGNTSTLTMWLLGYEFELGMIYDYNV